MNKYTYDYTCHMPKEGARQRVHMALDYIYILELTSPDHSGVRYWVLARCVSVSAGALVLLAARVRCIL